MVEQGAILCNVDHGTELRTLLGSCVSVCIFDKQAGAGGMTHFVLPFSPPAPCSVERAGRHGPTAIAQLIAELTSAKARKDRLTAKLFGGAAIMRGLSDIGQANISAAQETLRQHDIPVSAQCVGGTLARRVRFHPATGAAWVQKIEASGRLLRTAP